MRSLKSGVLCMLGCYASLLICLTFSFCLFVCFFKFNDGLKLLLQCSYENNNFLIRATGITQTIIHVKYPLQILPVVCPTGIR